MYIEKIKEYVNSLIGRTLENVTLACEMMMFTFGDISIHSQCFSRIMYKESILLTTLDYQNWDGVTDTNNDEWYNLSRFKNMIVNNKVLNAELTETNDLLVWCENDIRIQLFISNSTPHYDEDSEQWRIFENNNSDAQHIVVYSQSVQAE